MSLVDLDKISLVEIADTHELWSKDYVYDLQYKVTDLHKQNLELTDEVVRLSAVRDRGDFLIDRAMELARIRGEHWLVTVQSHWTTDLRTTLEKCYETLVALQKGTPHQLNPIDLNSDPLQ